MFAITANVKGLMKWRNYEATT